MLDFQIGFGGVTNTSFQYKDKVEKTEATSFSSASSLSLGLSTQLHKFVYLKSEFGLVNAEDKIDKTYNFDGSYDIQLQGNFITSRMYIGIIPEIRALDGLIYFNAGILICKELTNEFSRGTQITENSYRDISGNNMVSSSFSTGTTLGMGINPTYKNIGVFLGVKSINLPPVGINDSNPKFGFNTLFMHFGLSYRIN